MIKPSLICPVCKQPLSRTGQAFQCENNHQFDVAKQGYVNLLQPQHKKSKQPGDSPEMVEARFRFLDQGHYQTISDTLNGFVLNDFMAKADHLSSYAITDAGSGEGYYTQRLAQCLEAQTVSARLAEQSIERPIIGFDISQKAVKAACRRSKSIQWVTATSSHIPIADHSQDVVLSLFSRIVPDEFKRILKQDGLLYVASTGPNHLIELREKLYQDVKQVAYNPASTLGNLFTPMEQELNSAIRYTIEINDNQSINDLLLMTPHYWRASPSAKASLQALNSITATIDIKLTGYRLCPE